MQPGITCLPAFPFLTLTCQYLLGPLSLSTVISYISSQPGAHNAQLYEMIGHNYSHLQNKSSKQQLCKSDSSLLCSLSGCWWFPGAVGGSEEQMSVIHEVSVSLRDGIKIVWCIHVITTSFLLNVSLTAWIRFSRWEHFAHTHMTSMYFLWRAPSHAYYAPEELQ